MTPFQFTFSSEIYKYTNHDNYQVEICIVKEYIEKRLGTVEIIQNDKLFFKGTNIRNNVFSTIKSGQFTIEKKEAKLFLTYKIEFEKTIIYIFLFGVILGIFSIIFFPIIWMLCILFLWLGGGSYSISLIRNGLVLNDIVALINNHNEQKEII